MASTFEKVVQFACEENIILVFVLFPYGHNEEFFLFVFMPPYCLLFYHFLILFPLWNFVLTTKLDKSVL